MRESHEDKTKCTLQNPYESKVATITISTPVLLLVGEANQTEEKLIFTIGPDYNGEFDPGSG